MRRRRPQTTRFVVLTLLLASGAIAAPAARAAGPAAPCTGDPSLVRRLDLTVGGQATYGTYVLPAARPRGLVVFGYGYTFNVDAWRDHMRRAAARDGLVAVAMNYRGLTDKPRDGTGYERSRGFPVKPGGEDLVAAARHLQRVCGGFDRRLLLGVSMGGNATGLAAAMRGKTDDVPDLRLLGGRRGRLQPDRDLQLGARGRRGRGRGRHREGDGRADRARAGRVRRAHGRQPHGRHRGFTPEGDRARPRRQRRAGALQPVRRVRARDAPDGRAGRLRLRDAQGARRSGRRHPDTCPPTRRGTGRSTPATSSSTPVSTSCPRSRAATAPRPATATSRSTAPPRPDLARSEHTGKPAAPARPSFYGRPAGRRACGSAPAVLVLALLPQPRANLLGCGSTRADARAGCVAAAADAPWPRWWACRAGVLPAS